MLFRSMMLISPTIILIGITNLLGIQILTPIGKEKIVLLSVIGGAIIDFILNLIIIPRYGAAGASFSTLIAELLVLIIQLVLAKKIFTKMMDKIKINKIVVSNVIAFGVLMLTKLFISASPFIALLITSIIYFGVYLITLLILKEQLISELFAQITNKFKGYIH